MVSVRLIIGFIFLITISAVFYYFIVSGFFDKKKDSGDTTQTVAVSDGTDGAEITLFHATWCPACKAIKSGWDQFKNDYSNQKVNGYTLVVNEVDCSEPDAEVEDIMNRNKITGFPTVKLVYSGKVVEMQKRPTYDNLVEFVNTTL
jgi:thiol-disulfide isomerase/thioredoxin